MFFPEPVLFEVPVLPRVQKFMRVQLTDETGQLHPMLASPEAGGPGLFLWALAQSEKVRLFTNFRKSSDLTWQHYDPTELTAKIGVGLNEFHYTRNTYLLNAAEQLVFSSMVDHMIRNELVQYCEANPEVAPMVLIKRFCDKYDFSDDDFSESALKQMYLRHRKQTGASGFSVEINRQFAFVPVSIAA